MARPELLIAECHGTALRLISEFQKVHYHGLQVAVQRCPVLPPSVRKRLIQLEVAHNIVRHVTFPSCVALFQDLADLLYPSAAEDGQLSGVSSTAPTDVGDGVKAKSPDSSGYKGCDPRESAPEAPTSPCGTDEAAMEPGEPLGKAKSPDSSGYKGCDPSEPAPEAPTSPCGTEEAATEPGEPLSKGEVIKVFSDAFEAEAAAKKDRLARVSAKVEEMKGNAVNLPKVEAQKLRSVVVTVEDQLNLMEAELFRMVANGRDELQRRIEDSTTPSTVAEGSHARFVSITK